MVLQLVGEVKQSKYTLNPADVTFLPWGFHIFIFQTTVVILIQLVKLSWLIWKLIMTEICIAS